MDRAAEKKKEARKGGAARKKAGRKQRDPSESDGDSGQDRSAAASPDYIAASDKDSDEQLSTADGGTMRTPQSGQAMRRAPTASQQQRHSGRPGSERRGLDDPDASRMERPVKKSRPAGPSDAHSPIMRPQPVPRTRISETPQQPVPRVTAQPPLRNNRTELSQGHDNRAESSARATRPPHTARVTSRGPLPSWVQGYREADDPHIRNTQHQFASTSRHPMPNFHRTYYQRQAPLVPTPSRSAQHDRHHPTTHRALNLTQVRPRDAYHDHRFRSGDESQHLQQEDEDMYDQEPYDEGDGGYYMHADEQFGGY